MMSVLLVGFLLCSGLHLKVDIEALFEVGHCEGLLHSERVGLQEKG